jgi:hypothetical protein
MTWGGRGRSGQPARRAWGPEGPLPIDRRRTGGRHIRRTLGRRVTAAGAAGDAVEARGLKGLGEGHRGQDGGEPPGQHGRARPWRANEGRLEHNACIRFAFASTSRG